ncbi:MAG: hypothetical protein U0237_20105 [Thermoleophilia bacterium]
MRRSHKAQVAADLRTAARMIERHGWAREPYPLAGGALGASLAAAMCLARFGRWPEARGKELRLRDPRYRRLYETMLRRVQAEHCISICEWNAHARSADDVIHAVRSVADALDPLPVPPLVPVFASDTERRRSMRSWMARQGIDLSDLPPVPDDLVVVPDCIPDWMGAPR